MSSSESFLQTLTSSDGLKVVFSVMFVSTILTIYEISMFFFVVTPEIEGQINSNLQQVENLSDLLNKYTDNIPQLDSVKDKLSENIYKVFELLEERESILTSKINGYTKVTGIVMIIALILVLMFINFVIRTRGDQIGWCTYGIVVLTFVPLLMFQYVFYWYGKRYQYIGSHGQEELVLYLLEKLE